MKVEIENLSSVERQLSIEVPWTVVKEELDLAYKGLAKRAKVKGFRAGHVPRKVLEQLYKSTVEGEVLNRLIDDLFRKAVNEQSLVPIDRPVLSQVPEIAPDNPFRFVATVQVKPEVEVKSYRGLEVERKVREVNDQELARELEVLRQKAAVIEQVTDRKDVRKEDLAVIDFFGYLNGETFKGGKGINYTVEVGGGQMIPGFEDALIGMNVGDQKMFELTYPKDDGPAEVRGKKVEWKVDLKEVKKRTLPELDDEFAKDLGEYDRLDELKAKMRENLATREDARSERALRDAVIEKLVAENPLEVPPLMIERQLDFLLQDAIRAAQKNPEIVEALNKLRVDARPRAEKQVAGMLLLEAVARTENLEVTDQEIDGRLQEIAREHRMSVKQVRQQLKDNDQLEALRYNQRQDKAVDFVVANATVSDRTVTEAELAAEQATESEAHDPGHDHDHPHDHDDHHGHHDHHGHDHD